MNTALRSSLLAAGLLFGGAAAGPAFSVLAQPAAETVTATQADFYTIASYRNLDTRALLIPGEKLTRTGSGLPNSELRLSFVTYQLLTNEVMIPREAVAVTYNVTVTETEGQGFVQIDGAEFSNGSTSTVNWSTDDQTIANSGVALLSTVFGEDAAEPGAVGIWVGGSDDAATHVIIDITGYYMASE